MTIFALSASKCSTRVATNEIYMLRNPFVFPVICSVIRLFTCNHSLINAINNIHNTLCLSKSGDFLGALLGLLIQAVPFRTIFLAFFYVVDIKLVAAIFHVILGISFAFDEK